VRAECNYKTGIERKVREKLSEMVQRHISSVAFHASMKHYRAVEGDELDKRFFPILACRLGGTGWPSIN